MPEITNIPAPRVPIVDKETGYVTREWYQYFFNLFNLTGSGSNSTTLEDLQLSPGSMSAEAFAQIFSADSILTAPRNELGTMAAVQQNNVRFIGYSTSPSPPIANPPIGYSWWDGGTTLNLQMTANVTQSIGEDQFFYIKAQKASGVPGSSVKIDKGQVVMFTGSVGDSGVLTGQPAKNVTDGAYIMGVAAEEIPVNGRGLVQSFGLIEGIDTSTYDAGDILYYDPTSTTGGLTKTPPNTLANAPGSNVIVAAVVKNNANGSIFVRISAGSKLGGTDSNVQVTNPPNNNDILQYDTATGYWKNVPASGLIVSTATNLANGLANQIPYQTAPSTTSFISAPTTNSVLTESSGVPTWSTSLTLGANLSVKGNTTLGDAPTNTLTINGTAISCPNNLSFASNTLYVQPAGATTAASVGVGTAPVYVMDVFAPASVGGVDTTNIFRLSQSGISNGYTITQAATTPKTLVHNWRAGLEATPSLQLATGAFTSNVASTFNSTLTANGNVTLGDAAADTITVNGTPTFAAPITANGTATFNSTLTANGNVTLGDAAADTITVNGTPTFAAAATFNSDLSVKGNTTLGDASTDTLTINGTAISCPNNLNFATNTLYVQPAGATTASSVGVGVAPSYVFDVFAPATVGGATITNIFRLSQSGVSNGYVITSDGSKLTHSWKTDTSGLTELSIIQGKVGVNAAPTYNFDVKSATGSTTIARFYSVDLASNGHTIAFDNTSTGKNFTYRWATGTSTGVTLSADGTSATTANISCLGIGVAPIWDSSLVIRAGTATVAPIKLTSGTNLTTPIAGCIEYDGSNFYVTPDTTQKRNVNLAAQQFYLSAAGSAFGATIGNYFGATSAASLASASTYEIECYCYFLKTTAGTLTWAPTFSSAPTVAHATIEYTPVTGFTTTIITGAMVTAEATAQAVAAMTFTATASLTTAVYHVAKFKVYVTTNAACDFRLNVTQSAGTITPQAGSWYTVRRIVNNAGNFVA